MTNFFALTDLGLASSSSQLLQLWLTAMQAQYPGYQPSEGNLEYIQAQIIAQIAADIAIQASNGATELFRTYATDLVGVPYQQGVAAQAVITLTAQANPSVVATLSSPLTVAGGSISTLPVIALAYGIAPGIFTLTSGVNTQTWTTNGANAGDTSISVTSQTPNFNYPTGATLGGGTAVQQYVVPVLSQFTLDSLGFQNLTEVDINAGTTANLTLTAIQTGIIFNGAGSGGDIQPVQQLAWLAGISLVAPASNGEDPEDDTHYLNRVTTTLQLQAPRPITAADFGTMAVNFTPFPGTDQQEVARATAIDGYDPNSGTFNNAREVTVAAVDSNGFALNNDTLYGYPNGTSSNVVTTTPTINAGWGIAGWLQSLREANFIVNVINPTYSLVYVKVSVAPNLGWDNASVQLSVQAALLGYLSPTAWGIPAQGDASWTNTTVLRQSTLMQAVQSAPGVLYVHPGTLAFDVVPNPVNTSDLTLPGAIPLPISSTASIPTTAITVV